MGDAENLDALIAVVKTKVNELIPKPKMADKLLMKPPFRFLHDTITAITTVTGFGEGLYNEAELNSAAITEKQAKLDYLDKIFNLVGICKGKELAVKSARVVSGLEPENTNAFLIDLAECAGESMYDNAEAVRRCLAGEKPGERSPPLKNSKASSSSSSSAAAESKGEAPPSIAESKRSNEDNNSDSKNSGGSSKPSSDSDMAPERGKSRGGTRGGKPNQATADTGLGGGFSSGQAPQLDAEIERCDGSDAATQQLLGDLISKPKLTEKLLSKPPFRFLHDIVMEVMRVTGFGTGLYAGAELNSGEVNEKAAKLLFLEKVIRLVGLQLNTLVEAKPAKIVAGLDPPVTNNFLQLLAIAAKHLPDSTASVRLVLEQLGEGGGGGVEPTPAVAARQPEARREESKPIHSDSQPSQQEERSKPEERSKSSRQSQQQAEPKESRPPQREAEEPRRELFDDKPMEDIGDMDGGGEVKRSSRPQSALRRPPKIKDGAKELQTRDIAPAVKKAEGIIIDGQNDDDDEDGIPDESRLVDDIKADAKGSGGADQAQSKLVKDILSRQAEQEAAAGKGAKAEPTEEAKAADQANQGAGVRLGVRLGRNKANDKKAGGTSGVPTANGLGEGDLEKMRASIQTLVQHTGPLGTCMDFIQEDISLMTSELHKWEDECRRYEADYEEAKRKTKEALHPLKVELADVEDQIIEQIAKISSKKAALARNDEKISQVLKLIATA